jgi:hypothetical protein
VPGSLTGLIITLVNGELSVKPINCPAFLRRNG